MYVVVGFFFFFFLVYLLFVLPPTRAGFMCVAFCLSRCMLCSGSLRLPCLRVCVHV
eukprot:NODE_6035_length_474_cov_81.390588_g4545_i0.p3 GENE.NODE_6035_length_474_cov_81.390588_g4545_i0~~NODE_6035_length_474_cov_81.390588_g4545_i0.p3  ORF type:complete len:56 (+),score=15.19 NODE_6035_length_474_cov_81.390588_g4545_i0:224-391(+)